MTTVSTMSTLPPLSIFGIYYSGKGGVGFFLQILAKVGLFFFFKFWQRCGRLIAFPREKTLERLCNIVNCTPCTKYLTIGVRTLNVKEYLLAFCWEQIWFFLKSRRSKFLLMNGYFSLVQIDISCLNKLIFPICINMNIFWPNISHGPHIWIFLPFAWMYFPP